MNLFGLNFLFHQSFATGKLYLQKKIHPQKSSIKFSVNNFKITSKNVCR